MRRPSPTTSATAARPNQTMPSPGRQVPRIASRENYCGRTGVASHRPPKGLPHASRGQSPTAYAPVGSRAAPGLACGRAVPGRQDATRAPACKIGDHVELMIVGHFTVTKYIQITENNHRRRAFAAAKVAGDRRYLRPTTTTVRKSLGFGSGARQGGWAIEDQAVSRPSDVGQG